MPKEPKDPKDPKDKKKPGKIGAAGDLSPKQIAKREAARMRAEFGRHLHKLMRDRHLNQSDLARLADVGRDSISQYVNGNTMPIEKNAKLLADALGVSVPEIYPADFRRQAIEGEPQDLRLTMLTGQPNKCWFYINRQMSFSLATDIIRLIEGADKT